MTRIILVTLFLLPGLLGMAQSTPSATSIQDSVRQYFDVFRGEDDQAKERCAQNMVDSLFAFYQVDSNFTHQFDSLHFLGQLTSDDGLIRIITFNYPKTDGTFGYRCILLHKADGNGSHTAYNLIDDPDPWERLEFKTIDLSDWYGVLYYRIVQKRFKKKTYYTLLGWDGNNNRSNRKIVDVLDVSGPKPSLGAPIFLIDGRAQNRIIFEYAKDANMALNYKEKEGMIVMDHLAPEHPRLKGQFQFYGPDFSYDALKFKKGKWILIEDYNAENRSLNGLKKEDRPGDFRD